MAGRRAGNLDEQLADVAAVEHELQRFGVAVDAVDDLFSAPQGSIGEPLGESVGPYHFVQSAEPHARHRRAVSWIATGVVETRSKRI